MSSALDASPKRLKKAAAGCKSNIRTKWFITLKDESSERVTDRHAATMVDA